MDWHSFRNIYCNTTKVERVFSFQIKPCYDFYENKPSVSQELQLSLQTEAIINSYFDSKNWPSEAYQFLNAKFEAFIIGNQT